LTPVVYDADVDLPPISFGQFKPSSVGPRLIYDKTEAGAPNGHSSLEVTVFALIDY
jgi:hypothetical protein